MYSIDINGINFECPQNLSDITLRRMNQYFEEIVPLAPKDPITVHRKRIKGGRLINWVWRLFMVILRKNINEIHEPEGWEEYARTEVGFWLKIPRGLLSLISESDIMAIHQLIAKAIQPNVEPLQAIVFNRKVFKVDYLVENLPEIKQSDIPTTGIDVVLAAVLVDSDGKRRSPEYWHNLPADKALAVAAMVNDQQLVASSVVGKQIVDKVLYKK